MGGDRGPCNRWSTIRKTDRRRDPLQWTTTACGSEGAGDARGGGSSGTGNNREGDRHFCRRSIGHGVPDAESAGGGGLSRAGAGPVRVRVGASDCRALACGVVEWSGADAARARRGHADTHEVRIARRVIRRWALAVRRQGSGSRDHRNSGTGQEPSRECAGEGSVGARRAAAFGFGTSPGHGVHPR